MPTIFSIQNCIVVVNRHPYIHPCSTQLEKVETKLSVRFSEKKKLKKEKKAEKKVGQN